MVMKKESAGFTVLRGLLIAGLIGIIGLAGWLVWNTNQSVTSTENSAKTTTTTSQGDLLVIKEWGVELPVNSLGSNPTYRIIKPTADPTHEYAYISTSKVLDTKACQDAYENSEGKAYSFIIKHSKDDKLLKEGMPSPLTPEEAVKKYPNSYVKIDDAYYHISNDNIDVCSEDEGKAAEAYRDAFKNLKASS